MPPWLIRITTIVIILITANISFAQLADHFDSWNRCRELEKLEKNTAIIPQPITWIGRQ